MNSDSSTMRCVSISEPGAADVLTTTDVARPELAAGELRIGVEAAGVNRPDVFQRMGLYAPPPGASPIPGLEVAGVVEALAGDVRGWSVGDRVCALVNGGGYAEYVSVPASQCLPVPERLSSIEAAALPETCFTVWSNVYDRAALKPGERLLVHGGSSGIGTTAIQIATALGSEVYVTAGSDDKCRACERLGARRAINYRTQGYVEEIQRLTDGAGVNVVLDMVGGDYVQKNMTVCAPDGRIVNIAFLKGSKTNLDLMPVMLKRLTLTGSTLRPRSTAYKGRVAANLRETVWPLIEQKRFSPVIAATFALSAAADAHRLMESSAHIGKIVLTLSDNG